VHGRDSQHDGEWHAVPPPDQQPRRSVDARQGLRLRRKPKWMCAVFHQPSISLPARLRPQDAAPHSDSSPFPFPQVVGGSSGNASEGQCYSRFVPCPAGQYGRVGHNASGQGYCTDCPAGSTSHNKGSTWCQCTQAGQVMTVRVMIVK
jgi:hypothetical protein